MQLSEVVEKYRQVAGGFGKPVALGAFGLAAEETARLFSMFDEDYHLSRFFHFTLAEGTRYDINGFPQTHVSLDPEIESVL
ncbi:MAG: hypothetical protein ACRD50_07120 [Candidatus Acidiferrales bacterium]